MPLAVRRLFLNRTGARTTLDTAYVSVITSLSVTGRQGYNSTPNSPALTRTGPLQNLLPTPTGGNIFSGFGSYPNLTTVQPTQLPSGRPSGYNSSRLNRGGTLTNPTTVLPSRGVLPPWRNASSLNNGRSGGTGIFWATSHVTSANHSLPLATIHQIQRLVF